MKHLAFILLFFFSYFGNSNLFAQYNFIEIGCEGMLSENAEEKTKALKNSTLYVYLDKTSVSASIIKESFETSWKFCKYQFVNEQERDALLEDKNNFIFELRNSLQLDKKEDNTTIDYFKDDFLNIGITIYSGKRKKSFGDFFGLCTQTIQQTGANRPTNNSFYSACISSGGLGNSLKVKNLEDFYKYMSPYFTAYLYRMQYKLNYYLNLEENSKLSKKIKTDELQNQEKEIIKNSDFYLLNKIDSSSIEYLHIAFDIPKDKIHLVTELELKKIVDAQTPNAIIAFDLYAGNYITTLTNGRMLINSTLYNYGEFTKELLDRAKKNKEKQEKKKK